MCVHRDFDFVIEQLIKEKEKWLNEEAKSILVF